MDIAAILQIAGVAEPLLVNLVQLIEQMIADGRNTTTQQETDALNAAVTAAQTARQNYENT